MQSVFITTTRIADYNIRSLNGQPIIQGHGQITNYLARNLSHHHAALFAEPNHNVPAGTVDWYMPGERVPVALHTLSKDDRCLSEDRLAALVADIDAHAAKLRASPHEDRRVLGQLLQLALEIPDVGLIHALGDQPVLVGWGMTATGPESSRYVLREFVSEVQESRERDRKAAEQAALAGRAAQGAEGTPPGGEPAASGAEPSAEPSEGPADVPGQGADAGENWSWRYVEMPPAGRLDSVARGVHPVPGTTYARTPWPAYLLWAGVVAAGALTGYLLLAACGVGLPSHPALLSYCPAPHGAAPPTGLGEENALLAEKLRGLAERLRTASNACPAPAPVQEPVQTPVEQAQEPAPPAPERIEQQVVEQGGAIGEINVMLAWDSDADLDLHVTCPSGAQINFSHTRACGGTLDVDANAALNLRASPVENIVWMTGEAQPGTYKIRVQKYRSRHDANRSTPFVVEIRRQGQLYRRYERSVTSEREWVVIEPMTLPLPDRPPQQ